MDNMKHIDKIINKVLQHARDIKRSKYAAGGVQIIEDNVKYYRMGQAGIIPPEWIDYEKMIYEEEKRDNMT